jgi:hypothetical protein
MLAAAAALSTLVAPSAAAGPKPLLEDHFSGFDGLITNEFALYNPSNLGAVISPTWQVTSGSLFRRAGMAWTGVPDGITPDPCSCLTTDSAVFRMIGNRSNFRDVSVSVTVRNDRLVTTKRTPAKPTDGVHLILRWQSQEQTYYASVDRRDGTVAIKKKLPGGPVNGGAYTTLAQAPVGAIPFGVARRVTAKVHNVAGGVQLTLSVDGAALLSVVDSGQGGPPIIAPGRVGLRADNDELHFDDFIVAGS